MAGSMEDSEVKSPRQPLPFLEVVCKRSGKIRRFSVGTEAGFAVNLINKKLLEGTSGGAGGANVLLVSHIEAVKEEEEPVNFGPNSLLLDYGPGWKLQTVIESLGDQGGVRTGTTRVRRPPANGNNASQSMRIVQSPISLVYVGKIVLAFLLLFVIGAAFTLVLENLPQLILLINSSL